MELSSDRRERVIARIRACLRQLVGGSGHLSSMAIDDLALVRVEPVGDGVVRYHFTGRAEIVSEFTGPAAPDGSVPGAYTEQVEGWLELDEQLDLVRDEEGHVRLHPWRCRDPERCDDDDDAWFAALLGESVPTLRFFFDAGAGTCLWAQGEAARERFGYAVDLTELPVPASLVARLQGLVDRYDGSLDPGDPGGPSPWSDEEQGAFDAAADQLLAELQRAVGDRLAIVDERQVDDRSDGPSA